MAMKFIILFERSTVYLLVPLFTLEMKLVAGIALVSDQCMISISLSGYRYL